jgi:hypothetical protein
MRAPDTFTIPLFPVCQSAGEVSSFSVSAFAYVGGRIEEVETFIWDAPCESIQLILLWAKCETSLSSFFLFADVAFNMFGFSEITSLLPTSKIYS